MGEKLVIALGGNALQKKDSDYTAEEQLLVIKDTVKKIAELVEDGYDVTIVHGNGPQVGRILLQQEESKNVTPMMPLDVCGAMSQGYIGYQLAQCLHDELLKKNINKSVTAVLTQVVVDSNDRAFRNPTKPIGAFYTKDEAKKLKKEKGYVLKEDSNRGYRRVVASPIPQEIVELETIKKLSEDSIVITCGGGGIPVTKDDKGHLNGIECVIDKDFAAGVLASALDARYLLILTDVAYVYTGFKSQNPLAIKRMNVSEAERHFLHGEFGIGSMLPKVEAAMKFVKGNEGRKAIITSLEKAVDAMHDNAGTIIVR